MTETNLSSFLKALIFFSIHKVTVLQIQKKNFCCYLLLQATVFTVEGSYNAKNGSPMRAVTCAECLFIHIELDCRGSWQHEIHFAASHPRG